MEIITGLEGREEEIKYVSHKGKKISYERYTTILESSNMVTGDKIVSDKWFLLYSGKSWHFNSTPLKSYASEKMKEREALSDESILKMLKKVIDLAFEDNDRIFSTSSSNPHYRKLVLSYLDKEGIHYSIIDQIVHINLKDL